MSSRLAAVSQTFVRGFGFGALVVAALAACSSSTDAGDDDEGTAAPAKVKVACLQPANADGTDDACVALELPRKLDCEDEDGRSAALGAGCKHQDPDDDGNHAVCCPKNVSGNPPKAQQVDCQQKAGSDQDDACADFSDTPRKLTCAARETASALAVGCVLQAEGESDVCCPLNVSGVAKPTGSSSGDGGAR